MGMTYGGYYEDKDCMYELTWQMVRNTKHMLRFGSTVISSVCLSFCLCEFTWAKTEENNTVWDLVFVSVVRALNRSAAHGYKITRCILASLCQ